MARSVRDWVLLGLARGTGIRRDAHAAVPFITHRDDAGPLTAYTGLSVREEMPAIVYRRKRPPNLGAGLGSYFRCTVPIVAAALIAGCGTRVPDIEEIPGGPGSSQLLVGGIVRSIHCDIKDAVRYAINQDLNRAKTNGRRTSPWFDEWGVQVVLTLTVSEKTELNPSILWIPNPIAALFSLAGAVDLSSEATRTDTLNYFYTVADLYKEASCVGGAVVTLPTGSLLIGSNLRFRDFLETQLFAVGTGDVKSVPHTGLTHDVKFQIVTGASINPAWKTKYWSLNPSSSLFATNRNRTHEVSVTFGEADSKAKSLVGAAADQALASQLGAAIASRLGGVRP